MVKIYGKKYVKMVANGICTKAEAIELARTEVPERWNVDVIAYIEENC